MEGRRLFLGVPPYARLTSLPGSQRCIARRARVKQEYERFNGTLARMLETRGTEYLHIDYLKQWSVRKGVPLPVSE